MEKLRQGDPETRSPDLVAENVAKLRALFPEAFTDGGVDFDVLKQLLGGHVDESPEKYGLNWHGKRKARALALTPSAGTLRPCPEESVDWDTTQNLMIEGDNLEVLKLLQKSYAGKVKLIYIDPPYNTGNDFVYQDDFSDSLGNYLRTTGQVDLGGRATTSETETTGRVHGKWLGMMTPRLKIARNLLNEGGAICISIDDHEYANLRSLCDEVFGQENFIATIVWQKRYVSNATAKWLSDMHDYVVVYAKEQNALRVRDWKKTSDQLSAYRNPDDDPRGDWRPQDLSASKPYSAGQFVITGPTGREFSPPPNRYWRCNIDTFESWRSDNRIWWGTSGDARPMLKSFLSEAGDETTPHTWWEHEFAGHNKQATLELKGLFDGDAPFDTPKPVLLVERIIDLFCEAGDVVLDFFAGSGVTGHAALSTSVRIDGQVRFMLAQFPEATERTDFRTISAITVERLRRAGKKLKEENPMFAGDVGFRVFKFASSNFREWEPDRGNLEQSLVEGAEHLKQDRTELDILYELLLKRGIDLCTPIETRRIAGKEVHAIGRGTLMACLAKEIHADDVEELAEGVLRWHDELAPTEADKKARETRVYFRDAAFSDDVAKVNLTEILKQRGISDVRSL